MISTLCARLTHHIYAWACKRLYREFAFSYDLVSFMISFGRWSYWRRLSMDYVRGARVLEIGFGTGELLSELARRGYEVAGVDSSPAMQRITYAKLRRRGLSGLHFQALVQALPFGDGYFDTIVATFPAEYILDASALAECARVLRQAQSQENGGVCGRLVIVGLWVGLDHWLLRRLAPFFYGRPAQHAIQRLVNRVAATGLEPSIVEQKDGLARIGILVADR